MGEAQEKRSVTGSGWVRGSGAGEAGNLARDTKKVVSVPTKSAIF